MKRIIILVLMCLLMGSTTSWSATVHPESFTAAGTIAITDKLVIYQTNAWKTLTIEALDTYLGISTGSDTNYYLEITNNTSRTPTASKNQLYPEANIWKVNQNGTESSMCIGPTATQIDFSGTLTNTYLCTFATGGVISCNTNPASYEPDITFGTGVLTALGINIGSAGAPVLFNGNIGVSAGTSLALTGNLTGLVPPIVLTHASGVHDGSNDQAIMTDSGESFTTSSMVGMTVYNVTDVSSCTVTANDGTTITCTLAGGTDNNWDTNDVWQVGPGPSQSGSVFYVGLVSTIRHPATVGYAAGYMSTTTGIVTIEVASNMVLTYCTAAAVDAGDTIDSPATAGSMTWIHNQSATIGACHGQRNTWVDGGAS